MVLQDTDLKNPEKTRGEKTREKTRKTKNGKGFAVFFTVEQGVRNKRLW